MKKKLIIIVVIVIVAIAIYFAWKKYKKPSSNNSQGNNNNQSNQNSQYNINDISDNAMLDLAKSVDDASFNTTKEIVASIKKDTKMTQEEKDMFLMVFKGILYAKKDKNWDDKSKDVEKKRQTLAAYGVKINEIDWFIKRTS